MVGCTGFRNSTRSSPSRCPAPLGALALCALAGCQVNGSPHVFRAGADGSLYGPWAGAALLSGDASGATSQALHWYPEPGSAATGAAAGAVDAAGAAPASTAAAGAKSDTFTLTFDNAFFKYLPDLGTSNEVIIVFRFREGAGSAEQDDVRILGPMNGIPDGHYASEIGEVTYGPKPVESDALRVRVQVYEYDSLENEQTSQFVGFLADAAKKFQLANPVTLAQIELARTVADTLTEMNGNDLVFECSFDLLPTVIGADGVPAGTAIPPDARSLPVIPLQAGTWGVIRQEAELPIHSFFHYTRAAERLGGSWWWCSLPFTLIGDLVLLPITGVNRSFLDAPSGESLWPITMDESGLRDDGRTVRLEATTRRLVLEQGSRPYEDKTWLLFTIEAGRTADAWAERRKLRATQEQIDAYLKAGSFGASAREELLKKVQALLDAKAGPAPEVVAPQPADPPAPEPAPTPIPPAPIEET